MIIFFEIDKINVERYYFNRLDKNFNTNDVIVVLEDPNEFFDFKKNYPDIKVFLFKDWIYKYSKNYQNAYVIINGNRIPDLLMTKISKDNYCKVIYIQHGLYVRFMKRKKMLFIRKFKKAIRYVIYAIKINKLSALFKIHFLGHSRKIAADFSHFYPDYALVYSEYWKEWHKENYFFDMVPNYNFLKNNDADIKIKKVKNTAIYCYQTLVEDGRVKVTYFKSLMNEIIKSVEKAGLKLIIKGHPRMFESTRYFFENKGIEIIDDVMPVGGPIIGHYSSLLVRWVYEGNKLFLIPLKGHTIPDYLVDLSTAVCFPAELMELLNKKDLGKGQQNELKERSDYYFNFSGKDSIDSINDILKVI